MKSKAYLSHFVVAWLATLGFSSQATAAPQGNGVASNNVDPGQFVQAGLMVTSMVDEYQVGDVWDRSSPVMKQVIPRDRFVSQSSKARANCGTSSNRIWVSINFMQVDKAAQNLPTGQYVSVKFQSDCSSGGNMIETVTFHGGQGQSQWALIGYVPQKT